MVEGTDNPFIERPDEHVAGAKNELYCWIPGDMGRECNGSCVAFHPVSDEASEETHCIALNALRGISASMAINVALTKLGMSIQKNKDLRGHLDKLPQPPEVK